MKKTIATIVLGILFGAALGGLAYLSIFVGWALAAAGHEWFVYGLYVFGALAVSTVVGACLAKKNIVVTRVLLTIPLVVTIASLVFALIQLGFNTIFLFFIGAIILGLVATIFAYKTPRNATETTTEQTAADSNN